MISNKSKKELSKKDDKKQSIRVIKLHFAHYNTSSLVALQLCLRPSNKVRDTGSFTYFPCVYFFLIATFDRCRGAFLDVSGSASLDNRS